MKLKLENGRIAKFKLSEQGEAVTLFANGYALFTFYTDGSAFAHGYISSEATGLQVTKKSERLRLVK